MSKRSWLWLAVFAMFCVTSCEDIDLAKTESKEETTDTTTRLPLRTGEGTSDAPYTVTDVLTGASPLMGQEVWVIGYVVGSAYRSLNNATFSVPFEHDSNILLAADSLCTTASECIPVELKTTSQKNSLSLFQPERHHQCLLLQGTVSTYLSTTGLRSVREHQWLGNFTIPCSSPTDWSDHRYE